MKNWLIVILLSFASVGMAQDTLSDEEYVYPVLPGTPEWRNLRSLQEKLDATQIPPEKLKKMSTKALVKACLDYPGFANMWAFNTAQAGFNSVVSGFNGLQELLKRKDAGKALLEVYPLFDLSRQKSWPTINRQYNCFFPDYLDVLAAQKSILLNADKATRRLLMREAKKRYEQKKSKRIVYDPIAQGYTAALMARIMDADGNLEEEKKMNPKFNRLIESARVPDTTIADEIVKKAKEKQY